MKAQNSPLTIGLVSVLGGLSVACSGGSSPLNSALDPKAFASSTSETCQGTIGAQTVETITVPQGKTCTLQGTIVQGNIIVQRAATLRASGVKVNGNIQAEGSAFVDVFANSTVGGSIQVVQGRRARIVNSKITGDVQFESNSGQNTANKNKIGGNLQAFQNTGGVTIRENRIDGNLQCKENAPVPAGGGNIVGGTKEDQCRRL